MSATRTGAEDQNTDDHVGAEPPRAFSAKLAHHASGIELDVPRLQTVGVAIDLPDDEDAGTMG